MKPQKQLSRKVKKVKQCKSCGAFEYQSRFCDVCRPPKKKLKAWAILDTRKDAIFPVFGVDIDPRYTSMEICTTSAIFYKEEIAKKVKRLSDKWVKERKLKRTGSKVVPVEIIYKI